MLVAIVIFTTWLLVVLGVVFLCRGARRTDDEIAAEAQQRDDREPKLPLAS